MHRVAESLYSGVLQVEGSTRELLGQVDAAQPTLVNCRVYRILLWTGVKTGTAPVHYTVRGGDEHGWQWTHTGVIATGANQWFRITVKIPRRTAWLRIEVSGATQTIKSKIVGIRG